MKTSDFRYPNPHPHNHPLSETIANEIKLEFVDIIGLLIYLPPHSYLIIYTFSLYLSLSLSSPQLQENNTRKHEILVSSITKTSIGPGTSDLLILVLLIKHEDGVDGIK